MKTRAASCWSRSISFGQLVKMLQQQHHRSTALRHETATASVATCKPPGTSRRVSCAASQRDVSAGVASVTVSAPTADSSTTQSSKPSKPYRVTNTTIQDIKDFHKSQLREFDYVVDDSWVSRAASGDVAVGCAGTTERSWHQCANNISATAVRSTEPSVIAIILQCLSPSPTWALQMLGCI
jgi:hypothetical protein